MTDLLLLGSSLSRWMLAGRRCWGRVCKGQLQLGPVDRRAWQRLRPLTGAPSENRSNFTWSNFITLRNDLLTVSYKPEKQEQNCNTNTTWRERNCLYYSPGEWQLWHGQKWSAGTDHWVSWECVTSDSWMGQDRSATSLCFQKCSCFSLSACVFQFASIWRWAAAEHVVFYVSVVSWSIQYSSGTCGSGLVCLYAAHYV